LTYRGLVEDCFVPAIRSLVDAVLEAPYAEGSSAPDESGEGDEPGAARFRGSARWYEVLGCTEVEERGAVAVETAALLHQLLIFDEQLSRMVSDTPRAEVAAGRALSCRRWFQRAFWLPTPRRLADLEVERADPIGGAALAMRAGMLIAASLEGAPLDQIQRRSIVNASDQRLLTPLGLRSIDRADRGFRSDSASDGAVWPWLLGLHAEAAIRAFGRDHGRLEFQETLLSATDGAPEAWLESEDGGVMPTGDLSFSPARGESARAFRLLSEILGEDDGR
jgi:glycogen debranching enzyme